jgi:hypothetical protein
MRSPERAYLSSPASRLVVTEKARRLETANFDRALAAVVWEDAANTADETGLKADKIEAVKDDRALDEADRKIKRIESKP